MTTTQNNERSIFENAVRSLEAEIANVGVHLTIDGAARETYRRQIRVMADRLRMEATIGKITWAQAAERAQETRNLIMEIVRGRSTPIGRAIAEKIKRDGKTLNELIARKTLQLHGKNAVFSRLSSAQQNAVYAHIVRSAGASNRRVTPIIRRLSYAGRGLIIVSIALSVYTIATADNKANAAGKELAITGTGIGGGFAGGAVAGLACGPAAPVCVTASAFVGGALASFGASLVW